MSCDSRSTLFDRKPKPVGKNSTRHHSTKRCITQRCNSHATSLTVHLAAAYYVVSREADVCLATRSAAQIFGLDFIPLQNERYDLVMRRRTADLPAVKALLDILQRAALRRKLEVLAGYDTSETGSVVA